MQTCIFIWIAYSIYDYSHSFQFSWFLETYLYRYPAGSISFLTLEYLSIFSLDFPNRRWMHVLFFARSLRCILHKRTDKKWYFAKMVYDPSLAKFTATLLGYLVSRYPTQCCRLGQLWQHHNRIAMNNGLCNYHHTVVVEGNSTCSSACICMQFCMHIHSIRIKHHW